MQPLDYGNPVGEGGVAHRHRRLSTWNRLMIGVSVGVLLLSAISLFLPTTGGSRPQANVIKCRSNLSLIGQAIQLYAKDHQDALPPDFATLVVAVAEVSPQVFICASNDCGDDIVRLPSTATTQQSASTVVEGTSTCSYFLCKFPGQTLSQLTPRHVLAYEKPLNHTTETNGMNVLFADGNTEWIPAPLRDQVAAELTAGQNPPPSLR